MKRTTIADCKLLTFPKNHQINGNVTAINNQLDVDFNIKRVYYLYDVPGGAERGGHAHKGLHQVIIAASGSFDLILDDGKNKKRFQLNRPYQGIYLPPGLWRELDNFSSGSICLVLASEVYEEEDYFRDYKEFIEYKNQ